MKSIWKHVSLASVLICSLTPAVRAAELDTIFLPYGFINASYWAADHAVGSLGNLNSNFSAPVAAGIDSGVGDNNSRRSRGAFEVQQSRFGFQVMPKSNVRGKFEFDFLNAANAAPATASLLRLRIAKIEWLVNDTNMVLIGQDWDLFNAGVNPHTHNWVGNYFQGGNAGFMRQQLVFLHHTDAVEVAGAVGMAQNTALNPVANSAPTGAAFPTNNSDSDFSVPSLAFKAAMVNGKDRVGVAALYAPRISAVTVAGLDTDNSHTAFGAAAFAIYNISDFEVRAKAYWGQDLKDTGAFSISSIVAGTAGNPAHDTHEIGGFLSIARTFNSEWSSYAGFGYAKIAEDYQLATNALMRNWQVKAGGEYMIPDTKAKMFLELTRYATEYKIAAGPTDFNAYVGQVGVEMAF